MTSQARLKYRQSRTAKIKALAKQEKSKRRRARHEAESRGEKVKRLTPRTIELMRRPDDTTVEPDDEEIEQADETDEFSAYFSGKITPKVMLTTCRKPCKTLLKFVQELVITIPNSFYYKREFYRLKSIATYAINKSFTDMVVVTQHKKRPWGLLICHLPDGPTSYFRLSNVALAQEMPNSGRITEHLPEVMLNNFVTRLGRRTARQLAALFPQKPEFVGRRAICFHNQRDFVFFRQHRYIFSEDGKQCQLQEVGPRITMKLRWMVQGVFDMHSAMFEFEWKPDSQVDRKVMFM